MNKPYFQESGIDFDALGEEEILALESQYCSHGDTVHYVNPPKIFERC